MSTFEAIMKIGNLPVINRETVKKRGIPEIVDYDIRFARALQESVLNKLQETVNYIIQLMGPGVFYFQLPNPATGEHADGGWRFILNDAAIELQKKVSGVWTKQAKWA